MSAHGILSASRARSAAHPGSRAPGVSSHLVRTTAALAGLVLVAAALALPWVTVLHGTATLNGIAAGGGTLAGLATAAGLVLLAAQRYGWAPGRWLALGGAAIAGGGAVWAGRAVADYAADPGPAAALASPTPGPGPWVLATGAAVLAAAAVLPLPRAARTPDSAGLRLGVRLGLAATVFAAGWIHVLLVPEHWGESALLGAGFLGAGLLQLALAVAVVVRPGQAALLAVVALNVALVAVWLYAVIVGLPLGDVHGHAGAAGWSVGAGEPIDAVAAVDKAAEIAGAVWAAALTAGEEARGRT